MTTRQLIESAYKSAHYSAELTSQLYENDNANAALNPETVTTLLEQARGLNAAAQALENIARKHPMPKAG